MKDSLTISLDGWSNADDDYYEDDVDLRWFLLQTLILVFAMVSCVRCISACVAYRDAQLYEQLLANNPNLAQNQENGQSGGRQRWIGDNPPLSEEEVNNLPEINFSFSPDDKFTDDKTVGTSDETKASMEVEPAEGALGAITSIITNCTGGKRSGHYCTSCSVCLDEFEEGEKVKQLLPCNHLYHSDCIKPWLTQRSGNCPLCKVAVSSGSDETENGNEGDDNAPIESRFQRLFRWRSRNRNLENSVEMNNELNEPLIEVNDEEEEAHMMV